MIEISGDILKVKHGVICHQVNRKGVAGAGLAGAMGRKWPEWKLHYSRNAHVYSLGQVQFYDVSKHIVVASLFGQDGYGTDKMYTDYDALYKCFLELTTKKFEKDLIFPYGMGCGLGGGDWDIVYGMLNTFFTKATIIKKDSDVIIKQLGY